MILRSALLVVMTLVASACLSTPLEPTSEPTTTVAAPATTAPAPTSTVLATTTTTPLPSLLTDESTVSIGGLLPVVVGMSVEEAEAAAQTAFLGGEDATGDCYFVTPENGPVGVSFMVFRGLIARVDVIEGAVKTKSGAGIGTTEEDILALYGELIEVTPHAYVEGSYMTFVPVEDVGYRVVFETDGSAVTTYRAGEVPMVEFIEGCA